MLIFSYGAVGVLLTALADREGHDNTLGVIFILTPHFNNCRLVDLRLVVSELASRIRS